MTIDNPEFWLDCPLVEVNEQVKHGAPVLKGTRLEAETLIGAIDAYMKLKGMSQDEAIAATFRDHPTAPGKKAIRALLAYEHSHTHELQP